LTISFDKGLTSTASELTEKLLQQQQYSYVRQQARSSLLPSCCQQGPEGLLFYAEDSLNGTVFLSQMMISSQTIVSK